MSDTSSPPRPTRCCVECSRWFDASVPGAHFVGGQHAVCCAECWRALADEAEGLADTLRGRWPRFSHDERRSVRDLLGRRR